MGSRLSLPREGQEPANGSWPVDSIEHDLNLVDEFTTHSQIMDLLGKHNCRNLSQDLRDVTRMPVYDSRFTNVHRAFLRDDTKVAVKKVRPGSDYSGGDLAGRYQKRLARELYTWAQCDHRNVWPLMGLADLEGQLAIVSVWADHGNLVQYLNNTPGADRCELSLGITTGLAYLHRNGIVHGDLKGLNVLISANRVPMLCDFGSSVIEGATLQFADSRSGIGNTLRWAAPELLTGAAQAPTPATDVYSLGMTILETFTRKPPYASLSDGSVLSVILKKKFPARPEQEIPVESPYGNILWTLLRSCWSHNPNMRPNVRAVRYILTPMTENSLRPAPFPEPAQEVEYDDGDKVDYSNHVDEEDERHDRNLIKQAESVGRDRLAAERFYRVESEINDWEADEGGEAGTFNFPRGPKTSSSSRAAPRSSSTGIGEMAQYSQHFQSLLDSLRRTTINPQSPVTTDAAGDSGPHFDRIGGRNSGAVPVALSNVGSRVGSDANPWEHIDSRDFRRRGNVLSPPTSTANAPQPLFPSFKSWLAAQTTEGDLSTSQPHSSDTRLVSTNDDQTKAPEPSKPHKIYPPPPADSTACGLDSPRDPANREVSASRPPIVTSDTRTNETQAGGPGPQRAHIGSPSGPTHPDNSNAGVEVSASSHIPDSFSTEGPTLTSGAHLPISDLAHLQAPKNTKRTPPPVINLQEQATNSTHFSDPEFSGTVPSWLRPRAACPEPTVVHLPKIGDNPLVPKRQDYQDEDGAPHPRARTDSNPPNAERTIDPEPRIMKGEVFPSLTYANDTQVQDLDSSQRLESMEVPAPVPEMTENRSGTEDSRIVRSREAPSTSVSRVDNHLAPGRYYLRSRPSKVYTEIAEGSEDEENPLDEDFEPPEKSVRKLARNYRLQGRKSS